MSKKQNPHRGSSFDEFLREDGIYEEVTAKALKRVIAWKLDQARKAQKITKKAMAKRMNTSRSSLDRLLDPDNASVTLLTLTIAAESLGKTINVDIVDS